MEGGRARRGKRRRGPGFRHARRLALALALAALPLIPEASADAAPAAAAPMTVNSTGDANDASPGDGRCRTPAGRCTLRAAIDEANANAGPSMKIVLPAGRYGLTGESNYPPGDDDNLEGDLDVSTYGGPLEIAGAGARRTIIDGRRLDRVIGILTGRVTIRGVTVTGGLCGCAGNWPTAGGAGIEVDDELTLVDSSVRGNTADHQFGGGITNLGSLSVIRSTIAGNKADRSGGGIMMASQGRLNILNSTIVGNVADANHSVENGSGYGGGAGGGIAIELSDQDNLPRIVSSTIAFNVANGLGETSASEGGGILNEYLLPHTGVVFRNSIVAANTYPNCTAENDATGKNLQDDVTCFPRGARISAQAHLARLANNGGPTDTLLPRVESPAIDGVPRAACPSPAVDQRGVRRPRGARCDIGAVER